jgi:nucleoid-associated protein
MFGHCEEILAPQRAMDAASTQFAFGTCSADTNSALSPPRQRRRTHWLTCETSSRLPPAKFCRQPVLPYSAYAKLPAHRATSAREKQKTRQFTEGSVANQITGLIVHKFEKETHQKGNIVPRKAVIVVTKPVQRLVDALHDLYGDKPSKGYGKFEDNEDNFPMQRRVREYFIDKQADFLAFSLAAMGILKGKADDAPLSTGGYVLICHIVSSGRDYLLFAIVTETVGSAITENLDIVDSEHIDLSNFRLAGRIDLTGWTAKNDRYIGFLKGKKSEQVSGYFRHFMGCDDAVLPKEETQKLTAALQAFGEQNIADVKERDEWLGKVFDLCDELAKKKEPFVIEDFCNAAWPQDPTLVSKAFSGAEYELSDGFVPDKSALSPLVKFQAKTPFWKVEVSRKAFNDGEAVYSRKDGTLTLYNLPEEFKQKLNTEDDE